MVKEEKRFPADLADLRRGDSGLNIELSVFKKSARILALNIREHMEVQALRTSA